MSHHQPSRESGVVVGILNPSAGKQDALELAAGCVPIMSPLLDRGEVCSRVIAIDCDSMSQGSAVTRAFRNIVGGRG